MDVPDWKKTKLSLETPYRDDHGERIPVLLDITPAGEQVFEPPENLTKLLGENLRRIFIEREVDFFERLDDLPPGCESLVPKPRETSERSDEDDESARDLPRTSLTPEELYNMRAECISQLFIALGEMTQARDLLSLLLSSTSLQPISTAQTLSQTALTATVVTKPPPIPSVEVFNAQLTIGGKDEALRKAANVFKQAASKLEGSLERSENYWADALKIRRANWGLTPAPLPFGAPTGKGADKTSKDFLISFGLEEYQAGGSCISHNTANVSDSTSLDELLRATQKEIVDEEVFSVLIREASNLPAASTRVSERLIVIDAAEGIELRFEMTRDRSIAVKLAVVTLLILPRS
ncbi:hypothetical protein ID866_6129 [Astraeus odoratus]|nr:hypothetical protein ID866_6129 [Astraeus odoratus]